MSHSNPFAQGTWIGGQYVPDATQSADTSTETANSGVDLASVLQAFQDSMTSSQSSSQTVGQSLASYTPESLASQMQEIRLTDEHKSSGFKFATTSYMTITPGTMRPLWG